MKTLRPVLVSVLFLSGFISISMARGARADSPMNTVTATIGVGLSPVDVAVNPTAGKIYVANSADESVSMIDGASNTVTFSFVAAHVGGIAVNPVTGTVYVTNSWNNSVSVFDVAGNLAATIRVGRTPLGVAVNPATDQIYVANMGSNSVSVIDTSRNTVTATIGVGLSPCRIAVNSATGMVYVVNLGGNSVSVMDGANNAVTATIGVGITPSGVAVNPTTGKVYVGNQVSNSVSVIDPSSNTVTATIGVGITPIGIAVNPTTGMVYVGNAGSNSVSVIDPLSNNVTATIGVERTPADLAVNPIAGKIYVANHGSNSISVIDGASNAVTVNPPSSQAAQELTWTWADPDSSITSYSWSGACTGYGNVTTVTCSGLTGGETYSLSVIATNGTGTSYPGTSSGVAGDVPGVPTGVAATVTRNGSCVLTWSAPSFLGGLLSTTSYKVKVSSDGRNWAMYPASAMSHIYNFTKPGTAVMFQVAAVNDLGTGAYSAPITAVALGLAVQVIQVVTSNGQPVTGGAITWSATGVHSSVNYGLTFNGTIRFPRAPAGTASVTLTNGVMPDGSYVSGTYATTLGFPVSVITLPREPSSPKSTINVQTPSGLDIPGVSVSVGPLAQMVTVSGTTFTAPQLVPRGVTDVNGNFAAWGFSSANSRASVSYNDSVITQNATSGISSPITRITLAYEPVITPTATQAIINAGSLVSVTLRAVTPSYSLALRQSHKAQANVAVSLVSAPGLKTCAGQILSGRTNTTGQVTLKFCATTNVVVSFKATGAYAVGDYHVYVIGTVPTKVLAPIASTPALGQAKLTWTKPIWAGGSPITKYVVSLTSKNHPTVTMTATSTSVVIAELAHATKYAASIVAFNKYGTSTAVQVYVSVA